MNYRRLCLTVVAATIADIVYGAVVYGQLLSREVSRYGGLFRSVNESNANAPWLVLGLLLAISAVTFLYGSSRIDGFGIGRGLQWGAAMGLFTIGYVALGNYVVMRISRTLTAYMAIAGFFEWIVVGAVIGVTYRPPSPKR